MRGRPGVMGGLAGGQVVRSGGTASLGAGRVLHNIYYRTLIRGPGWARPGPRGSRRPPRDTTLHDHPNHQPVKQPTDQLTNRPTIHPSIDPAAAVSTHASGHCARAIITNRTIASSTRLPGRSVSSRIVK